MQRYRPFTGVLPNEFAGAATPAPGLPFHAVIPCPRRPFGAFSAFSAFFLSTAAEQALTLRGRGENFHFPLRPVPARPKRNLPRLSLISRFFAGRIQSQQGRKSTKFDHLDKTKDLAAPPLALEMDTGPLGRIGRLRRTLSPACRGPAVRRRTKVRIHPRGP
jgi:hypothetical protein